MKTFFIILGLSAAFLSLQLAAASERIIGQPGRHSNRVETELHTILGFGEPGAGFRVSIPVWDPGLDPALNSNVAVSFGVDVLRWPKADFISAGLSAPVGLQWNFFLTREWSVFGAGGVAFQNWFAHENGTGTYVFRPWPGLSLGARYHLNPDDYPTLVLRIGYPAGASVGVSF